MVDEPILLPGFLVASLYKNTLVEIIEQPETGQPLAKATGEPAQTCGIDVVVEKAAFLGGNKKHVGIVVNDSNGVHIADKDLYFLENILAACKLSLKDIAIFNIHTKNMVFADTKDLLQLKYLLLFGVKPTEVKLPFEVPNFQVQQYAGCTIMVAPALALMNSDAPDVKPVKRQLWESLKRSFNI